MPISVTQALVAVSTIAAFAYLVLAGDHRRWYAVASDRLIYGLPIGTAITVIGVVGFYLFVQGGLWHWDDPVYLPYVSWSYFYPLGILTAGFAHISPAHLVSNMTATIVFGPIVEYAWSHKPPKQRRVSAGGDATLTARMIETPWIRAVVIVPLAFSSVALTTAAFSLGPGLGFSGAVFALIGFAVLWYPIPTLIAIVVTSGLTVLHQAISEPIVRETIDPGTPGPPGWAGIGFYAHLLGFLIGVAVAIAVMRRRDRIHPPALAFFAVGAVGLVHSLWLLAFPGSEDTFVLYRGAGVIGVIVLTYLITIALTGSDDRLLDPINIGPRIPTRRHLGIAWLAVLGLVFVSGVMAVAFADAPAFLTIWSVLLVTVVLGLPAIPAVFPDRVISTPVSAKQLAVGTLVVFTIVLAAVGGTFSLMVVDDDAAPDSGDVVIGDWIVTYEQDATSGSLPAFDFGNESDFESLQSGLIVVNPDRQIWTVAERDYVIEHDGEVTIRLGGVGWSETVEATRSEWDVVGNDTVYAVDITADSETTRSFMSDGLKSTASLAGFEFEVQPSDGGFDLHLIEAGETIDSVEIPASNESVSTAGLTISTDSTADVDRLTVASDGDRVVIAERNR